MAQALLISRLLLALIFGLAGIGKLADLAGARRAMRDFGVPASLADPLGLLLPLAELAVAASLLPDATAWWGALGVLALLALFACGIGYNLWRGRQPDCHCFGRLYSAPIGWPTLLRNLVPAVVAGFVVEQGIHGSGASTAASIGTLSVPQRVGIIGALGMLVLVAVAAWLVARSLRQRQRLLRRPEAGERHPDRPDAKTEQSALPWPLEPALPIGSRAPGFALGGLHGETLSLEALCAAGRPALLVFSDPRCVRCDAVLPDLGAWQRDPSTGLTIALISRLTPEANRAKSAEHGLTNVLLQHNREVAMAYRVTSLPTAVLVRPDGTIGSLPAEGVDEIQDLVRSLTGAQCINSAIPLG
jgi:peroxiredoxin